MSNVSKRCGIFNCDYRDKNSDSKCSLYKDRAECSKSMKRRKKAAKHARKTTLRQRYLGY